MINLEAVSDVKGIGRLLFPSNLSMVLLKFSHLNVLEANEKQNSGLLKKLYAVRSVWLGRHGNLEP